MTKDQLRLATAIVRNLKRHRDIAPFLHPIESHTVPDYSQQIRKPMDLSTVEGKLTHLAYVTVHHFIADMRLIFSNCYQYNGMDSHAAILCQNVESAFEKGIRQMPGAYEVSCSTDGQPPRKFTSPVAFDLPKREIHPPASKDYPQTLTAQRPRYVTSQMKFCVQTLAELKKQKYKDINFPFLFPVDHVALNIPDYPTIVKHPMDLSTIENKLNNEEYPSAQDFATDVRLMFSNCYLYNPPSLPIYQMAERLEKVFEEKWSHLPSDSPEPVKRRRPSSAASTSQKRQRIAALERHIASLSHTSKKAGPKNKHSPTSLSYTYEEKMALSEKINNLSGPKLTKVVEIIQSSMPSLSGENGEIVLDIDSLDPKTIKKLSDFVNGPKRRSTNKRKLSSGDRLKQLEKTIKSLNRMYLFPSRQCRSHLFFFLPGKSSASDESSASSSDDASDSD
ncbi:Bromodomain-containing protein [Hesseltinella vesiculosa]|uniref:Bromodomain-containing protein n=1 Tax=Hesseltinella vesiculosa TaxID=101127 RepID=A0A1X2GEK8_9FUNG|nr:Bromodomain-containing protein [Hesseltinella vesiculosa]